MVRIAQGVALAICSAALLLDIGAARPLAQDATTPSRHALLIGVTKYPSLDKRYELRGPLNDVALVRATLQDRFGFNSASIVELSEDQRAAGKPTRANIEREFARLANVASRGDQVVVFYAGHGSQQPDTDAADADESDGLDEIILPSDVSGWDGKTGGVRNAITDDEIRAWITAIRSRGAFVFVVFDACQSSTLTRGVVETTRRVPVEELVPAPVMAAIETRTRGAIASESNLIGVERESGQIAALYAAQTTEPTPEKQLPDANGQVHGLFTYTLVEVLSQSVSPISYRDLVERVIARYRSLGRIGPTPGFEGSGLDEPVLGVSKWTGRRRLILGVRRSDGHVTLQAGAIDSLTLGTVLRVFPPSGRQYAPQSVGHVKIVKLDATSSLVEPIAFEDSPAPALGRLQPNSRAEVAMFDYGDNVFRVALNPDPQWQVNAPTVSAALAQLAKLTNGQAERAASPAVADWILSAKGEDIFLAPASGWRIDASASAEGPAPFRIGSATSPTFTDQLARTLGQIARVRGLLALANPTIADASDVDIAIELVLYKDEQDTVGTIVRSEGRPRVLHPGDQIAFRLRNSGKVDVDVTLLFISSQYGIDPIFPRSDAEADSTVSPGREVVTARFGINDETVGWEQVVAIAVQSARVRTDFRYLAQPSLDIENGERGTRRAVSTSPLQRLLERSVFGQGETRGISNADLRTYAIKSLGWQTERAR